MIVNTVCLSKLVLALPVICAQRSHAFARLPIGGFAFLYGGEKEEEMKLHIFFALIDLLILLAYPIVFIIAKTRQFLGFKR
jgi:hypothetical protein